jgi:hypothetical protein
MITFPKPNQTPSPALPCSSLRWAEDERSGLVEDAIGVFNNDNRRNHQGEVMELLDELV